MKSEKLKNYLALLKIRQAARRRDTWISGGVFFIFFALLMVFLMLNRLSGNSLYLILFLQVCFAFAYLTSWVRLEILKGTIELINNLPQQEKENRNHH